MQIPYAHPSWIEINLSQFKKNIAAIKNLIKNTKLCFPVKANAYGHGLIPIGKAAENNGVDYLAVSCLQEGILLREANISLPILVLGAIHEEQIPDLIHYDLEFTISSQFKADLVYQQAQKINKVCKVHIEIETGMQRTGMRCESAEKLIYFICQSKYFKLVGIYSHMATADIKDHHFAHAQINLFNDFISNIKQKIGIQFIAHLANSGGVCFFPESHFDMVRPGLLTLGYFDQHNIAELQDVAPFFELKAKVSYFKVVAPHLGVSYNHTYTTQKQTRLITVPVGYGDGYRRCLSNKGDVIVRGQKFKISGNVCMDQFMVDIGQKEAFIGDEVVLIGKQGQEEITVQDVALQCDTIPYEVLCLLNDRIPRIYKD